MSTSAGRVSMSFADDEAKSIVQILNSQPDQQQLLETLRLFQPFSICASSAVASVIFTVVNTTLPELWRSLRSSSAESKEAISLITFCLSSISGVNALLLRLDQLRAQTQQSLANETPQLEDIIDVLTLILEDDEFSPATVIDACLRNGLKGKMLLNEYISIVAGSKILSIVSKISLDLSNEKGFWISDGKRYSRWLGHRLSSAIKAHSDTSEVALLLSKSLNIGYPCLILLEEG